jgi:hypothetical protein
MTDRTKRLSMIAAGALVCLWSGAVLDRVIGHAGTNTAEVKQDCILVAPNLTSQTSCPSPATLSNTTNVVLNIGAGAQVDTCTFGDSSLSPVFLAGQGLGPTHIQIPQLNDTANVSDSAKSFGSGGTVTYTATTLTDTTKTFPASFVGATIQSIFNTAKVASVSGNVITLMAAWSPATPTAGDPYQAAPCTDNLGGHDQVVAINGWGVALVDAASDEGTAEGSGTAGDTMSLYVPANGAVIYQDSGQCITTLNYSPTPIPQYHVNGAYDDVNTFTINGTGSAGLIPLKVAGGAGCPIVSTSASFTSTLQFSQVVQDAG